MWFKWLPWKYVIRRIALTHGFLDPIALLTRLRGFAKPSEVAEPMELVRAGLLLHARGLINTKVIQHNLDWIWPFWVEKQFDPTSASFLPRAFSITHVNLTHRNWTAVGLPGCSAFPIVDPRGLVTPQWDGWSLDGWIVTDAGDALCPSREDVSEQSLFRDQDRLTVQTATHRGGLGITAGVYLTRQDHRAICHVDYRVRSEKSAWFVVALRPYNPEGISFVNAIQLTANRKGWSVDGNHTVRFDKAPDRHAASTYAEGDLFAQLPRGPETTSTSCNVGLATAAALFKLEPDREKAIRVQIIATPKDTRDEHPQLHRSWDEALRPAAQLDVPDPLFVDLYTKAIHTLILLTPGSVYPGPYTYKRFWYRDAALMAHALLCSGFKDLVGHVLQSFPRNQSITGYFHSQSGEWDSNGEVLWILARYAELTGQPLTEPLQKAVYKGAKWICRKRLTTEKKALHAGLLPAGFSAEHLGNNDYYYWDDFWGVAGLRGASALCRSWHHKAAADEFLDVAERLEKAIDVSFERSASIRHHPGFPASPYRRMDAGAMGSLAAAYPLVLLPPDEERIMGTCRFLMDHCMVNNAFFQDIIHSGLNAYLTLHLAQVLLRTGDTRFRRLIEAVADLATPTGQWPEAIHPRTGGGCMGDGQHGWAAAEWVMMMRHLFIREEPDHLIIGSGLFPEWLQDGNTLHYGPTPTPYGDMEIGVSCSAGFCTVKWNAQWKTTPPRIRIEVPGFVGLEVDGTGTNDITLTPSPPQEGSL